jgi:hypothetical protein
VLRLFCSAGALSPVTIHSPTLYTYTTDRNRAKTVHAVATVPQAICWCPQSLIRTRPSAARDRRQHGDLVAGDQRARVGDVLCAPARRGSGRVTRSSWRLQAQILPGAAPPLQARAHCGRMSLSAGNCWMIMPRSTWVSVLSATSTRASDVPAARRDVVTRSAAGWRLRRASAPSSRACAKKHTCASSPPLVSTVRSPCGSAACLDLHERGACSPRGQR